MFSGGLSNIVGYRERNSPGGRTVRTDENGTIQVRPSPFERTILQQMEKDKSFWFSPTNMINGKTESPREREKTERPPTSRSQTARSEVPSTARQDTYRERKITLERELEQERARRRETEKELRTLMEQYGALS
eukprot:TRINITY_DN19836_c0_g1::TRINITY_DN19836_c0_g1_i1::g.28951::m.28951 TRINITY_DN19836_c0_g1::TRINITY_DN19836_c0_g1_i1::g.28951  ORF type:complete len:134 (-),score=0.98 TRINITY_DN19836_c0_g1_i1:145-546(-)